MTERLDAFERQVQSAMGSICGVTCYQTLNVTGLLAAGSKMNGGGLCAGALFLRLDFLHMVRHRLRGDTDLVFALYASRIAVVELASRPERPRLST
jgi:hypothetical protein